MNRVVVSGAAESPQIETKRRPDMTHTDVIPDYLKPAMERLETAREEHLINARHMDETTAAISRESTKRNWSRKTAMIPAHGAPPFVPVVLSLPMS